MASSASDAATHNAITTNATATQTTTAQVTRNGSIRSVPPRIVGFVGFVGLVGLVVFLDEREEIAEDFG